jgi:hypothetical protein
MKKAIHNFIIFFAVFALCMLKFPSFSFASTISASQKKQILQTSLNLQVASIKNWLADFPDQTKEKQDLGNSIRLSIFHIFGVMNVQDTQTYEKYYGYAQQSYQNANKDIEAAQTAFARGDYATANKYLVYSDGELLYANNLYSAANGVWMGQLTAAQTTLSNICTADADMTSKLSSIAIDAYTAGTAALASSAVSASEQIALNAMCNAGFGHNDKTLGDIASTIITTGVEGAIGSIVHVSAPNLDNFTTTVENIYDSVGTALDLTSPPPPPAPIASPIVQNQFKTPQTVSGSATAPAPTISQKKSRSSETSQVPHSSTTFPPPTPTPTSPLIPPSSSSQDITALVVDQFGNPVSEATLKLVDSNGKTYSYQSLDFGLQTDRDGYIDDAFDQIPNGSYTLIIEQDGYDKYQSTVQILSDNKNLGKIVMNKWSTVSAIVSDSSGSHPSWVFFWLVDSQGKKYGTFQYAKTYQAIFAFSEYDNTTGKLQIGSVPAGRYTLHVESNTPTPASQSAFDSYESGYNPSNPTTSTPPSLEYPSIDQPVQVSGADVFLGMLTLQ